MGDLWENFIISEKIKKQNTIRQLTGKSDYFKEILDFEFKDNK